MGSVKGPLVASIDHPQFIGGHPMAGSEQVGLDGASGELFVGATWVLTPTATTDPAAYTRLRNVLADLGADVVALAPGQHDSLVAVVSHVPHLTAATLMALAADLGLRFPDFRAAERTFQLLTQVAGRAGRNDSVGEVVNQTGYPDDPAIAASASFLVRMPFITPSSTTGKR